MTTRPRRATAVLAATIALAFTFGACGEDANDAATSAAPTPTTAAGDGATGTTAAGAGGGGEVAVDIAGFAFDPADIQVSVGGSVTWTNGDDFAHTVTAADDSFDSGNIDGGASFTQAFDTAGEFPFFCNIHNYMKGTVTVT